MFSRKERKTLHKTTGAGEGGGGSSVGGGVSATLLAAQEPGLCSRATYAVKLVSKKSLGGQGR